MLGSKKIEKEVIAIPARIARRLSLKDGMIVEAKVEKGKLVILRKREVIRNVMKYAGIWKNENVDKVFGEIRRDWEKWEKNLSV